MCADYFSDRERGPRARTLEELSAGAWGGIVVLVYSLVETGALGVDFPEACPDGLGPTGTNAVALWIAARAEIPDVTFPLENTPPPTLAALDLLEFLHHHVAEPRLGSFHPFLGHNHLTFAREQGQQHFRERVNRILARNGIAFEIGDDGRVVRLTPVVLRETLASAEFRTGDAQLDSLLETARQRIVSPDPEIRRDALEKLWDAWERAKTLDVPTDKKASVAALLDAAAGETNFRDMLEVEAKALTQIGNTFGIRHSETSQTAIERSEQVDYLFHRLFALVQLILRSRS